MNFFDKCLTRVLIIVLGMLIGCLIACFFGVSFEKPIIQISQSDIFFGEIASGTKVTKTVEIRNVGLGNLIIHKVETGCGCVQVNLSQTVIGSNEAAQLDITMDATEYGQKTFVYIFSNDLKHKIMELSISAESAMQTIVEPSIIDFGQIADSEQLPVNKEINVLLNSEIFLAKDNVHLMFFTDNPYLQIDSSKPAIGNSKPIILTLPANVPIGELFTELQVLMNNSSITSIRVIGNVRGNYFALPPMLLFHQISPKNETITQTIEIQSRHHGGIEYIPNIESFELSNSLKSLISILRSDRNKIILTFSPSNSNIFWAPSTICGGILLKCSNDHLGSKEVNVPIQITLSVPKIRDK
jgi:hypothetical protein